MLKKILIGIGGLCGVFVFVFVLELFGLGMFKFFAPKRENVRREVFEQTKSYVHGKVQDLGKYYEEYQSAKTIDDKDVIRNVIKVRFAEFDESKIKDILMMPLSCRNPNVVAVVYALVLYKYAYSIASILEKTPCDRSWKISCRKIEKCMLESFPTERDHLKKEFEEEREWDQNRLKVFEQKYGNETITLIDNDDPAPFIEAIENKEGCL